MGLGTVPRAAVRGAQPRHHGDEPLERDGAPHRRRPGERPGHRVDRRQPVHLRDRRLYDDVDARGGRRPQDGDRLGRLERMAGHGIDAGVATFRPADDGGGDRLGIGLGHVLEVESPCQDRLGSLLAGVADPQGLSRGEEFPGPQRQQLRRPRPQPDQVQPAHGPPGPVPEGGGEGGSARAGITTESLEASNSPKDGLTRMRFLETAWWTQALKACWRAVCSSWLLIVAVASARGLPFAISLMMWYPNWVWTGCGVTWPGWRAMAACSNGATALPGSTQPRSPPAALEPVSVEYWRASWAKS